MWATDFGKQMNGHLWEVAHLYIGHGTWLACAFCDGEEVQPPEPVGSKWLREQIAQLERQVYAMAAQMW